MELYTPPVPLASRTQANRQSAGEVEVSTPCGPVSSRGITFSSPIRCSCIYGRVFVQGIELYTPRVPLASRTRANQRSAGEVGVSTPFGAVSTRGITVFVTDSLKLYMYGRISDPGMIPYPPRAALAPQTRANQRSASGIGVSTTCGAV